MLISLLTYLLISNALTLSKDKSILFSRIVMASLILNIALALHNIICKKAYVINDFVLNIDSFDINLLTLCLTIILSGLTLVRINKHTNIMLIFYQLTPFRLAFIIIIRLCINLCKNIITLEVILTSLLILCIICYIYRKNIKGFFKAFSWKSFMANYLILRIYLDSIIFCIVVLLYLYIPSLFWLATDLFSISLLGIYSFIFIDPYALYIDKQYLTPNSKDVSLTVCTDGVSIKNYAKPFLFSYKIAIHRNLDIVSSVLSISRKGFNNLHLVNNPEMLGLRSMKNILPLKQLYPKGYNYEFLYKNYYPFTPLMDRLNENRGLLYLYHKNAILTYKIGLPLKPIIDPCCIAISTKVFSKLNLGCDLHKKVDIYFLFKNYKFLDIPYWHYEFYNQNLEDRGDYNWSENGTRYFIPTILFREWHPFLTNNEVPLYWDLYPNVDITLHSEMRLKALTLYKHELLKRLYHIEKVETYLHQVLNTLSLLKYRDTPVEACEISNQNKWFNAWLWIGPLGVYDVPSWVYTEYSRIRLTDYNDWAEDEAIDWCRTNIVSYKATFEDRRNAYILYLALTQEKILHYSNNKGIIGKYGNSLSARFKENLIKHRQNSLD